MERDEQRPADSSTSPGGGVGRVDAEAESPKRAEPTKKVPSEDIGTTPTHRRPPFADPLPDAETAAPGHPLAASDRSDAPDPSPATHAGSPLPHPPVGPHDSATPAPPRKGIP